LIELFSAAMNQKSCVRAANSARNMQSEREKDSLHPPLRHPMHPFNNHADVPARDLSEQSTSIGLV